MVGLKNGHIRKNLTQKVVNPRDIAGERKKKKKKKKKKKAEAATHGGNSGGGVSGVCCSETEENAILGGIFTWSFAFLSTFFHFF